ncbi:MAG: MFS transporter, partial [Acidobacteria bacterium]|nr:MFS transporter [Acidobacteriota bacterium]
MQREGLRLSNWIPTVSMMLVSLISYVDRITLALLAPTILAETHLSGEQYGIIISAFSIAYMVGNPLWGRFLDRVGLRIGMTLAVGFWTLASLSHAFAVGFWSFAIARALLGFGEGATFPGGLRTVIQTLPPSRRSRGIAISYSGGSLGAIVTPIIITPIFLRFGWRAAFWFTGLIGVAWLAQWFVLCRRKDLAQRPGEMARVLDTGPDEGPGIRDPRTWGFMSAYALGALPLAFVVYGAAIYLSQALGKSQADIGAVLWIPPLGWEVGYFVWGWISDRVLGGANERSVFRKVFAVQMLLSLPLAAAPWIPSYGLLLFELFFAMFIAAGIVILSMAYVTRQYSSRHAGLMAGLGAG